MLMTTTRRGTLEWERVGGAHPGIIAEYGDWQFRVYAWQPGSFSASVWNRQTNEERLRAGNQRGEIKTQVEGERRCEEVFQQLLAEDRKAGIERG